MHRNFSEGLLVLLTYVFLAALPALESERLLHKGDLFENLSGVSADVLCVAHLNLLTQVCLDFLPCVCVEVAGVLLLCAENDRADEGLRSNPICHHFNVFENLLVGEEHVQALVVVWAQKVKQGRQDVSVR